MMGKFDTYNDSPNAIRYEGQEISLNFNKTSPTSARISWNIPTPTQGCSAENQAYDGIIITIDTTETNVSKTPKDGTIYESDITVDRDIHAGDRIDSSLVIGAFYNDKETTFLDISGLSETSSYYVSGFAVDQQKRYHTQGVHAYALSHTNESKTDDTPGCHSIQLSDDPILLSNSTGLIPNQNYTFEITYDVENLNGIQSVNDSISTYNFIPSNDYQKLLEYHTINVNGLFGQTYGDLLDSINYELKKLDNPFIGNNPPNVGGYYWNASEEKLYTWDGYQHVEVDVIYEALDPTIRNINDLWFDGISLHRWNGTNWIVINYVSYDKNPMLPDCSDYWYDGTTIYNYDGNVWCETLQFIQNRDPSLPIELDCGDFWYDSTNDLLNKLDNKNTWNNVDVIYYEFDPSSLPVGTLWFNDSTNELHTWNGTSFDIEVVTISDTQPVNPNDLDYWYDPVNFELHQYSIGTTSWILQNPLIFDVDPTNRTSCDLWWNKTTDELYIWDSVTSSWSLVGTFIQQTTDPMVAPNIAVGSTWYDSLHFYKWDGMGWVTLTNDIISQATNPLSPSVNDVWFDFVNSTWYVFDGVNYVLTEAIESPTNPESGSLALNSLWFDSLNQQLNYWNGVNWIQVAFSTSSLAPANDTLWLNPNTQELKRWFKNQWNDEVPRITASYENCEIKFCSKTLGSSSNVVINSFADGLFTQLDPLSPNFQYLRVEEGTDSIGDDPLYAQIGVGTDGSAEERRELIDSIRHQLGYPTVEVELTKQQFDYCIDSAIEEIRKRTGVAYKRGFFFMDTQPGEQRYFLTSKNAGFNKIVSVNGIHRTTSSFLRGFDNGVFGQTAVNFLYNSQGYDLLSYHLYSSYVEELEYLFATKITWQFNEQTRALDLLQSFYRHERLLLDVTVERTEQDLIRDRYLKTWIEEWSMAQAMLILNHVRGKYATLPGANGISLNASDMYAQAQEKIVDLLQQIDDYIVETPEEYGQGGAGIILG